MHSQEINVGDTVDFQTNTRWGKSGVRSGVILAVENTAGAGGGERLVLNETVDGVTGIVRIRRGWIV